MSLKCPRCQSARIETHHYGEKVGSALGTAAGAATGWAGIVSGAEVGAAAGLIAGPAGAVLGALVGGAAGCIAGSRLGTLVDKHVLDSHHCLACDHHFSSEGTRLIHHDG